MSELQNDSTTTIFSVYSTKNNSRIKIAVVSEMDLDSMFNFFSSAFNEEDFKYYKPEKKDFSGEISLETSYARNGRHEKIIVLTKDDNTYYMSFLYDYPNQKSMQDIIYSIKFEDIPIDLEGWEKMEIKDVGELMYPSKLEIRQEETSDIFTSFFKLSEHIVLQPKNEEFSANVKMIVLPGPYGNLNTYSNIKSMEKKLFSSDNLFNNMMGIIDSEVIVRKVADETCFNYICTRNNNTQVDLYVFLLEDKAFLLLFNCPIGEKDYWKKDFKNMPKLLKLYKNA